MKNSARVSGNASQSDKELPSSLVSLACGVGCTLGPTAGVSGGTDAEAGLSEMGGGGTLVGNWRRAAPVAAVLAAFEAELPIPTDSLQLVSWRGAG